MSYTFECPFCQSRIEVPDELDGTSANCPKCSNELFLTRDDAVEEPDAILDQMRRQNDAAERQHQEHLRVVMQMQDQNRRTRTIIKWIIYIFIVFPLAFWFLWFFISFVYGCFTGFR